LKKLWILIVAIVVFANVCRAQNYISKQSYIYKALERLRIKGAFRENESFYRRDRLLLPSELNMLLSVIVTNISQPGALKRIRLDDRDIVYLRKMISDYAQELLPVYNKFIEKARAQGELAKYIKEKKEKKKEEKETEYEVAGSIETKIEHVNVKGDPEGEQKYADEYTENRLGDTFKSTIDVSYKENTDVDPKTLGIKGVLETRDHYLEQMEFYYKRKKVYASAGTYVIPDYTEYTLQNTYLKGAAFGVKLKRAWFNFTAGRTYDEITSYDVNDPNPQVYGTSIVYEMPKHKFRGTYVKVLKDEVLSYRHEWQVNKRIKLEGEIAGCSNVEKDKTISEGDKAWEFKIKYKKPKFNLDLKYKYVGPDYVTYANSTLQTDIEKYEANANLKLTKHFAAMIGGSYYNDNNEGQNQFTVKTRDAYIMGLYTAPKKPRIIAYYKFIDKFDDSNNTSTGSTDNYTRILLGKFSHTVMKNLKVDANFTMIDYRDDVNDLTTTTKQWSFGLEKPIFTKTTAKVEYTGKNITGTKESVSHKYSGKLTYKANSKSTAWVEYWQENSSGNPDFMDRHLETAYERKVNENNTVTATYRKINYDDNNEIEKSYISHDWELKWKVAF